MMTKSTAEICFDPSVAVAQLAAPRYPEAGEADTSIEAAIEQLAKDLGWHSEQGGAFGNVIPRGARVLVKPNFVLHENQGPGGFEPLVTHASIVRAAVEAALRAGAGEVVVGDAPIQSCDFDSLMAQMGLGVWAAELMAREPRFKGIRDFRRTTCVLVRGVRVSTENLQSEDNFVLFDLGGESLLEPVTDDARSFRVTWYDPRLMAKTHHAGKHQYLVAREVIEADVIINLPKLKTHKKAGVTCALKNLIGINGNKEYLPHHRLGGAATGGDCYPGESKVKRVLEFVADRQNLTESRAAGHVWHGFTYVLTRLSWMQGDKVGYEGSWSGNDTIWRTCLDLNRILLYGRADATLGDEPQRRVLHLVDAVVAGQGNGPLSPDPLPMGMLLAGQNAAAVDWVGAYLLGYEPRRIAIAREAFGKFRWPLVRFGQGEVEVRGDAGNGRADEVLRERARGAQVAHPVGWVDAAMNAAHDARHAGAAAEAHEVELSREG